MALVVNNVSISWLQLLWSAVLCAVVATWFVDLLNGVRGVLQLSIANFNLATLWYVYTFYAPVVIASHLMIFGILFKARSWKK